MKRIITVIMCIVMGMLCLTSCGDEKSYEYGIRLEDGVNYKFYTANSKVRYAFEDEENLDYSDYVKSEFDKNGNVKKNVKSSDNSGKNVDEEIFTATYNSQNYPVSIETIWYDTIDGESVTTNYTYAYDEKNRVLVKERKEEDGDYSKIEYTYDDNDRVIKKVVNEKERDSSLEVTEIRTIEYAYSKTGYSYISRTQSYLYDYINITECEYIYYEDPEGKQCENLVCEREYREATPDVFFGREYTYFENGHIKNYKCYNAGELVEETIYTEHNNATTYIYENGEKIVEKETIILDNGAERVSSYEDGALTGYVDITYNEYSDDISRIEYDAAGTLIRNTEAEYRYSAKGERLYCKLVAKTDGDEVTIIREYDDKGRRTHTAIEKKGVLLAEDIFAYDGDKILSEAYNDYEEDSKIFVNYAYDDDGNLLEEIKTMDDKTVSTSKYDSYGNLLYEYDETGFEHTREAKGIYRAYIDDGRPDIFEVLEKIDDDFNVDELH